MGVATPLSPSHVSSLKKPKRRKHCAVFDSCLVFHELDPVKYLRISQNLRDFAYLMEFSCLKIVLRPFLTFTQRSLVEVQMRQPGRSLVMTNKVDVNIRQSYTSESHERINQCLVPAPMCPAEVTVTYRTCQHNINPGMRSKCNQPIFHSHT